MATETLTHFKKNLDPRYISGEDLKYGEQLNHGLRPEMIVTVSHFEDKETYDQSQNKKAIKTGLFLKEYPSGNAIYKPVILNNTNAKFFAKETGSPFMERWLNIPVVLWAMPDSRFDFVARFKKYFPPAQVDADKAAIEKLNACEKTSEALNATWKELTAAERKLPTVLALVEKLKGEIQQ
jgi:hypothetical protein